MNRVFYSDIKMDSRGSSACYSSSESLRMWSAHQAEAPEATSTPAALPTAGQEGVDNTLLTPPNSPSNSSLDIYEEFEFYASSRLSHLEDGASAVVSDSASSGGAPDPDELTASVRRLTELIGQLQRLEETRSRLIGEVAQSDQADLTLASLKTIQCKKMSSLNRGIGGQGLFKIKGRSSKSSNVTSVPVNPEVSKIEEVQDECVSAAGETILAVRSARMGLRQSLASTVHTNALQLATSNQTSSAIGSTNSGWSFLLGRCFNLSLNLKILMGNGFNDPNTAGKCYADFDALESHLDLHWLKVNGANIYNDLSKAREAVLAAANSQLTPETNNSKSLCLKQPMRRLLKLSPLKF